MLLAGFVLGLLSTGAVAQETSFEKMSLCDLLKSRARFSGRLVSVDVEIVDVRYLVGVDPANASCGKVALMEPSRSEVIRKPPFNWDRDAGYLEFEIGLRVLVPKPPTVKGSVTATFEGRFDSIYERGRPERGGFGHQGLYNARLVVRRVFDVRAVPGETPINIRP